MPNNALVAKELVPTQYHKQVIEDYAYQLVQGYSNNPKNDHIAWTGTEGLFEKNVRYSFIIA